LHAFQQLVHIGIWQTIILTVVRELRESLNGKDLLYVGISSPMAFMTSYLGRIPAYQTRYMVTRWPVTRSTVEKHQRHGDARPDNDVPIFDDRAPREIVDVDLHPPWGVHPVRAMCTGPALMLDSAVVTKIDPFIQPDLHPLPYNLICLVKFWVNI